jgi:hypothetical protein
LNQAWYTTADVLNFSSIKVIGLFTDSAATASAVFFVLGFPAAALTAYWLGRQLALSRPSAVTAAVLFSVLPGHQEWFHHLWLAAYWPVPLAVWLIVKVARGEPLWPSRAELRGRGAAGLRARLNAARTAGIVAAVGLADVYYVAFALLLLGTVLIFRLGTGTRAVRLLPGGAVTAAIGLLCAASLFAATRGRVGDLVTGALPAQRLLGESETYAGKLIELLLPWHEHRSGPLRYLSSAYGIAVPPSVERPALGIVSLVGVIAILWLALTSVGMGRKISATWGLLAALTLVSLAFYTKGGLGSVVALFFTPQIRTWSRFVVLIGLFGLLGVGLLLTRLGRRHGPRAAWVAAALVVGVGVLDQTNPGVAPRYAALERRQAELTAYTNDLSRTLHSSCAIFQLPVVSFPEETPPGSMEDYDHFLPSIASPSSLSWSYGAIRGTSRADWQLALPVGDQSRLLADLAAAGFCAVEIDRDGYSGSNDPSAVTTELVGEPIATAERERLAAYDLRGLATKLSATLGAEAVVRRREAVLRPIVTSLSGSLVDTSGNHPAQWTGPTAILTASNMGRAAVPVTLSFEVAGNGDDPRSVTVAAAGAATQTVTVSAKQPKTVVVHVSLPPGRTEVRLEATGPITTIPGTQGREHAVLKVSDVRATTDASVNVASLQQFAEATTPSLR